VGHGFLGRRGLNYPDRRNWHGQRVSGIRWQLKDRAVPTPREPGTCSCWIQLSQKTCLCHHPLGKLAPGDPFGKPLIQLSLFKAVHSATWLQLSAPPVSSDSASLGLLLAAFKRRPTGQTLGGTLPWTPQLSAREGKSPKIGRQDTLKRLKAGFPSRLRGGCRHRLQAKTYISWFARRWQRMRSRSDATCLPMEMGVAAVFLKWYPPILISTLSISRFFQDKVPPVDPRGDHVRNSRLLPRKRTSPREPPVHLAGSAACESAFKRPGRDAQIVHDCFCASFCLNRVVNCLGVALSSSGRLQQS
jgi:hypothetical protein